MDDARSETVRRSFERLFDAHGLPEAIRSDNGRPLPASSGLLGLSRLSAWWVALGIDLERGRPVIRRTMERMSGCIATSAGSWKPWVNRDQAALDLWRQAFNYERPHEALGMRCSGGSSTSLRRENIEGTPGGFGLSADVLSPGQRNTGTIRVDGQRLFLSTSFGRLVCGTQADRRAIDSKFGLVASSWARWILATSNFIRADIRPNKTAEIESEKV